MAACGRWQAALPGVGISVNVSPRCLADDGIVSVVEGLLVDQGLPARLLTLEITESSIMTNPKGTLLLLERLRELGVRLSIDDFGTGYTSLSYLRRLPVTEVKIDKSFVMGSADQPRDPTIVRSIVDLAHNLGLVVVAEGVAEPRMWRDLVAVGCELGQGHAIGAPLPLDQGRAWMMSYRPHPPGREAGRPMRSAAAG